MEHFTLETLLDGKEFSEWPISQWLDRVYEFSQSSMGNYRSGDQRKSPLWDFTRYAKAHPQLTKLSDAKALRIVEQWLQNSGKHWNVDFESIDSSEDGRDEFINSWHAISFVPGADLTENALRLAKEKPLDLSPDTTSTARYAFFVSYIWHLQDLVGEKSIVLPCHHTGDLFSCSHTIIAGYIKRAIWDGYLTLVTPHSFRQGKGKNRAAEYRVQTDRLPEPKARHEET
jgi:hypothetical protein